MQKRDVLSIATISLPYSIGLMGLAFAIPLLVSGPQLLTGTLVNCFLFLSASIMSTNNRRVVAVLPSIAALLNGLIFGGFTIYLAYFLPFIWISNIILMSSYLSLNRHPKFVRILLSASLKSLFLFLVAFAFFRLGVVPKIFLTAMGIVQFATAAMGGVISLGLYRLINNNERHR